MFPALPALHALSTVHWWAGELDLASLLLTYTWLICFVQPALRSYGLVWLRLSHRGREVDWSHVGGYAFATALVLGIVADGLRHHWASLCFSLGCLGLVIAATSAGRGIVNRYRRRRVTVRRVVTTTTSSPGGARVTETRVIYPPSRRTNRRGTR